MVSEKKIIRWIDVSCYHIYVRSLVKHIRKLRIWGIRAYSVRVLINANQTEENMPSMVLHGYGNYSIVIAACACRTQGHQATTMKVFFFPFQHITS